MPGSRPMRTAVIDAGFAVATRLNRFGLAPQTARAGRVFSKLDFERHSVDVDGLQIGGSLADHGTYLRSLRGPGAHPFQLELFVDELEPGYVVIDCGAHIGLHTLLAARRVGAGGAVIAIEPVPESVAALRANVRGNGFDEQVEVVEAAAADTAGTAPLHLTATLDQAGLVPYPDGGHPTVDVARIRLDEVMRGRRFDVAKIDVEGAEALALAGLEETLSRSGGARVFVECHPARLGDSGVRAQDWLSGLRERGSLELIDERDRRLVAATDEVISRAVREHSMAFNLRWTID